MLSRNFESSDRRHNGNLLAIAVTLLIVTFYSHVLVFGANFDADFDGPITSWSVRFRESDAKLTKHERRRDTGHRDGAEFISIATSRDELPIRFEHEVPAAQVLDELEATVWIKSDRPGIVLAMRLVVRGEKDPSTGGPVTMILAGDAYQSTGSWQQLKCQASDKKVSDQLRQLRAKMKKSLREPSLYLDRIVLGHNLSSGSTQFTIDDLEVGPIIPVDRESTKEPDIAQTSGIGESKSVVPVEFRLHRMRVEGRPFFPRIIRSYNERPEVLGQSGVNVVWVPDPDDVRTVGSLRRQGLWLTATPPFARDDQGNPLESEDASLLPFSTSTSPILFHMMGTRLTAIGKPKIQSWANQVRDADRTFKRPLAADVADDERLFSRHLDLIGISRHVMNTEWTLNDYRQVLGQKRDRTWPGTLCFSWVQTEPSPEIQAAAATEGTIPVIEPEQIRGQVYAALAEGCRGLGFWTTTPIDGTDPVSKERFLAIQQLNQELALLGPWLATGQSVQVIPMLVDEQQPDSSRTRKGQGLGRFSSQPPQSTRDRSLNRAGSDPSRIASVIRSEFGTLVLPMWLEDHSQYVPGPMSASNVSLIVPGGGETATVWEIQTTGRLQHLSRETVAGGIKIVLPRFDQTAAILLTSDQNTVEQLNQRIASIQEESATTSVSLGRAKLERVEKVESQLRDLGISQHDRTNLLEVARSQIDRAEAAFKQQEFRLAQVSSNEGMRLLRILQRSHWNNAIGNGVSPTSSPFLLSYQTLPAHVRLMRRLESKTAVASENKLPSGEFEDLGTLVASGWKNEQPSIPGVKANAELQANARQGRYGLKLMARPTSTDEIPTGLSQSPIVVTSPPLSIHSGQAVKITGWTQLTQPVIGSVEGATIQDSVMGKNGAIRVKVATGWQKFEMLRVVPESQELTVTISLHGFGDLAVDDLRITTIELPDDVPESEPAPPLKPARFSPLDNLDIRRFNPIPRRKP